MFCEIFKIAVESYHDIYLENADRAWEIKKAKWMEAAAEAARRRHAVESETAAARRSSVPGTLSRHVTKTNGPFMSSMLLLPPTF
jgi:hypothetical protein